MSDAQLPELPDPMRKELIETAKWMVNLSSFFLTASLALAGFFRESLVCRPVFYLGWAFMCLCIGFNWLIVKRLVAMPIVQAATPGDATFLHQMFAETIRNLKYYGTLQNLCFVAGSLLLVFAVGWNATVSKPQNTDALPIAVTRGQ